jgi:hypothetical protein
MGRGFNLELSLLARESRERRGRVLQRCLLKRYMEKAYRD